MAVNLRDVVVLGVGMTPFGRFPDKDYAQLGRDAVLEALKDAGLEWKDIPVIYCGNNTQGNTPGQRVQLELASQGTSIFNIKNACAAGAAAFNMAYVMVAAGQYDIALALGLEKTPRGLAGGGQTDPDYEELMGISPRAAKYAQLLQRELHAGRITLEQAAKVSVKNHKNGSYNPRSQYRKMITVEEVLSSRMICPPYLTLLHCCPTTEGAAAAILCTEQIARRHATPPFVKVAAGAITSRPYVQADFLDIAGMPRLAAKRVYEASGYGPEDLDLVELHDCFTIAELKHYENLGLCQEGEAARLIDEGETEITGRIPVNTSGGLLSKGHPLGATGVAQVCELTWQLRGQAGQRQVKDPKLGLAHTQGNQACGINMLKK